MLFRLCKLVDKPLFAAGCGMQMLAYYCATGYRRLNVMNGEEKGGELRTIKDITPARMAEVTLEDAFLDSVTGDFYTYKSVGDSADKFGRKRTSGSRWATRDCTA